LIVLNFYFIDSIIIFIFIYYKELINLKMNVFKFINSLIKFQKCPLIYIYIKKRYMKKILIVFQFYYYYYYFIDSIKN